VFAARQFVNHGHVKVNGRRVTIPSFQVKPNDVIEVREKARNMAMVLEALQSGERDVPDYIEVDVKAMTANTSACPSSATCRTRCRWSRTSSSNITRAKQLAAGAGQPRARSSSNPEARSPAGRCDRRGFAFGQNV
jgi:ribosomal protein S4